MGAALEALPEILFLALVFFSLALAFSAKALSHALLGGIVAALETIPLIGSSLAGPFRAVDQAIGDACGAIVSKCEALVGASFHVFARLLDWEWRQIVGEAAALLHVARLVGNGIYSVTGLRTIVHQLEKVWHGIEHGVKTLTKDFHRLEGRVKTLEREIAGGIGHDLRIHIKALEKWEAVAKAQLAADAKAITQTLPAELTQLENFIKAIPGVSYLDWAAGIVTAALGVEIFRLFRCSSLLNSAKNRGCGLWNGLEDLLGLFVDVLFFASACEILVELSPFISDVAVPAVVALTDVGAGLCQGGIGAPPPLPAVALFLPANPGVALQLP